MPFAKLIFVILLTVMSQYAFSIENNYLLSESKTGSLLQPFKKTSFHLETRQPELLPPDQAFQFFAEITDTNTLKVNWKIAENYYLYREKIQLEIINPTNVKLGTYTTPHGTPKYDEAFGQVEIFHDQLAFDIPILRTSQTDQVITLKAKFQGCADRGVCYPPMSKTLELKLSATSISPSTDNKLSDQDRIVQSLHDKNLWTTLLSFFGFGLLLSLTPCIFPMIPILSGIIVGHGNHITTRRAFLLSLSYVISSALTYTTFGILAALFGSNLQSTFQHPLIIGTFSALFVVLSLSMFGFYHLEVPKSLQAKLHNSSERHRNGSLWGAAIMGSLSSLIVGPCVAAPLAGALIYIGQTGNALLGGSALFAMGFGMGVPLLLLGASAGKLLPKAGDWLNATKAVFGVIMLAVAVWMVSRIIPPTLTMFLWAILLILPSIYLKAIDPLPEHCSNWYKLWKGIGLIMLSYGLLLLIGLSMGNTNPLVPLQNQTSNSGKIDNLALRFQPIKTIEELQSKLAEAKLNHKKVMLDFYADWCISCKEMEVYTFNDPEVKNYLSSLMLLRVDITQNTADDQALLTKFSLIGPPAIIFFDIDGSEKIAQRVIGYQDAPTFLQTLTQ